jgi:YXWGXW repeat-containing protein
MRSQLHRLIVSTGLAAATLLGAAGSSFAQPRDHRHNPPDVDAAPREAPPVPRAEPHDARRVGFVWIGGRWDWNRRERRWDWLPGRWEREHRGKHWREPRWEQRDGVYVLVDGDWIDAAASRFPVEAPPAPRPESHDARKIGFVWVGGRWDWQNGSWTWLPGRWERERVRMRWVDGRWELRGDHWEWVDGSWGEEAAAPPAPPSPPASAQYPTREPPAPRDEHMGPKAGFVWASGRWDWQNGNWTWLPGHWERERVRMRWVDGRWKLYGDHWGWVEGGWIEETAPQPAPPTPPPASGPTQAPPPPRAEVHGTPKEGFAWVGGRWAWQADHYEWLPGHWERVQARLTWYDGRWEQHGNVWVYIEGGWR